MPAPRPFVVVATQNPIESEGVYPLPEAQRDRFLMRIPVDYPTPAEERQIVSRFEDLSPTASRLLDPDDVVALQAAARAVTMDEPTADYAVRLVLATRDPAAHGIPEIAGQLEYGASPRASIGIVRAARALALLRGRTWATPQDVYDVAYDVLNLRLVLSYRALADGVTIDDVLVRLLRTVPAPGSPRVLARPCVGARGRRRIAPEPGTRADGSAAGNPPGSAGVPAGAAAGDPDRHERAISDGSAGACSGRTRAVADPVRTASGRAGREFPRRTVTDRLGATTRTSCAAPSWRFAAASTACGQATTWRCSRDTAWRRARLGCTSRATTCAGSTGP